MDLNQRLLEKYKDEYGANDTLQTKLSKIVKNHAKHQNDDTIKDIIKQASTNAKLVQALFQDENCKQKFQSGSIGSNLTCFACLCPVQDDNVMETLTQIAVDPKVAARIVKNNLLGGLTE